LKIYIPHLRLLHPNLLLPLTRVPCYYYAREPCYYFPYLYTPQEQQKQFHYEDLFGCMTRNFGKGFMCVGGFRLATSTFRLLLALASGRGKIADIWTVFEGTQAWGTFGGALLALTNGWMYLSRTVDPSQHVGRQTMSALKRYDGGKRRRGDGETERRRDGETERRRDGETERRRDGETERRREREGQRQRQEKETVG
jgi:hypothetical protein